MKIKGIRIFDDENRILTTELSDILEEVSNANSFYWSILWVDGVLNPGQGKTIFEYESEINDSKNGLITNVAELKLLSDRFYQMYEVVVLASTDISVLHHYETDEETYKACDIVIELIDCVCWEVYAKDQNLIRKLQKKYKDVEMLEVDV